MFIWTAGGAGVMAVVEGAETSVFEAEADAALETLC